MKRALGLLLLAFSLTGCAVHAGYYSGPDRYWMRDHDRYEHHRDGDDRWR